ncbi:MAG: hypothetical protein A2X25_08310 [Chloroflexi bacterium GWB2_49_20]|nr:MAG: hypothetical protein A2X25_08310 [Chloroflexi bacterium GWB2_49_20]OGN79562.1 MAG: hypothetical protein A2X26_05715 [Chloroflexi bacterium GWC2_49_37]OGN84515.1 MAG: hypothetical protein A2X27_10815 [Chloroflexi bacterium GWD2_49_16]HBG74062.1 hypothetical protein [Anaerolineae bacterium]HCC78864.1 hypothetical protein [Anaerolineae bacterium]
MKLPSRIIFFIFISGLILLTAGSPLSKSLAFPSLNPTPLPNVIQTSLEATATVDPASIGDTSGVIAFGIILVFIILAGILWGILELRQESYKTRQTKE